MISVGVTVSVSFPWLVPKKGFTTWPRLCGPTSTRAQEALDEEHDGELVDPGTGEEQRIDTLWPKAAPRSAARTSATPKLAESVHATPRVVRVIYRTAFWLVGTNSIQSSASAEPRKPSIWAQENQGSVPYAFHPWKTTPSWKSQNARKSSRFTSDSPVAASYSWTKRFSRTGPNGTAPRRCASATSCATSERGSLIRACSQSTTATTLSPWNR